MPLEVQGGRRCGVQVVELLQVVKGGDGNRVEERVGLTMCFGV